MSSPYEEKVSHLPDHRMLCHNFIFLCLLIRLKSRVFYLKIFS
ncbi:Uncharacterized protein dnm_075920 [Desulfonema magnum]|uniref:Uncharacterized protein n=1 Tax=Desulfonema magnum TaxID=45655 RepID=A0A975BTW5_9BACT|nr:Uncharacterized protein dnm_075920 [Desulfonema magnum]